MVVVEAMEVDADRGPSSLPAFAARGPRRHYKKDTRFLLDLYHLTYDDHESLDTIDDLSTVGSLLLFNLMVSQAA